MLISVTGTACSGKSTFINNFIKQWPMYKKADESYRNKIKSDPKIKLNKEGDEYTQRAIRDCLYEQVLPYDRKVDNIIFDRCILDNLAYSFWLKDKFDNLDDTFIEQTLQKVRETLPKFDIIFFFPIAKQTPITLVPAENRDMDETFRSEIDMIFKAMLNSYHKHDGTIFPKEDCPAPIEIIGNPIEMIEVAKLYINSNGKFWDEKDSLLKDS